MMHRPMHSCQFLIRSYFLRPARTFQKMGRGNRVKPHQIRRLRSRFRPRCGKAVCATARTRATGGTRTGLVAATATHLSRQDPLRSLNLRLRPTELLAVQRSIQTKVRRCGNAIKRVHDDLNDRDGFRLEKRPDGRGTRSATDFGNGAP